MSDDTVKACPECGHTKLSPLTRSTEAEYQCETCYAYVDEPDVRERKASAVLRYGPARDLHEMDPDDLMTDGGQQLRYVEGPVPDECTTKLCQGHPKWAVAMRDGVSRHRGTEHELSPPVGAVCPYVCQSCRDERYAGIDDHRWVQVREVATDGGDECGPERVVFLDAEDAVELLREGHVDATLAEEASDGTLDRSEVRVSNLAGPHPHFEDDDPGVLSTVVGASIAALVSIGVGALAVFMLPPSALAVGGEPASTTGILAAFVPIVLLVLVAVLFVRLAPYVVDRLAARVLGGDEA